MKKTFTKRITAGLVAVMLSLTCLVGCNKNEDYEDLKNAYEGTEQGTTDASGENNQNNDKDYSEELAAIQEQINNLTTEVNSVKAENEELRNENATLKAEAEENQKALEDANAKVASAEAAKAEAEAEVVELEALVETLKAQTTHKIHVIDNIVWVHIDDFLYAANGVGAIVNAEDGSGSALRTLKGVHVKVYDDEHGDEHLVPNFDLPMYDYYNIVLTADEGKTAFVASFGGYSWANGGLMTSFTTCEFAKELTSMPKNGGSGKQFYALILATAVVVEEDGAYRFAIDAGEYGPNPVITPTCQHGNGCHCGDCDKCPALEAETIVKTETETVKVCMICGDKDCKGHVETKVETETVYIPGETVYVPGETVYVPGETIYVDREVEVEVKYCGRCDNLLEECTCSNPEHNERPEDDGPAHNDRPTDNTETPEHNDKTEDNTPEHNDRPGSTTSEGEHSERPNESNTNNENSAGTTDAPAHSPRP